MNSRQPVLNLAWLRSYLQEHAVIWLVPMVAVGALGTLVAALRPTTWQAAQGLVVRDEVLGELSRYGRFDNTDARKAAQETIIQVARNRNVVLQALKQYNRDSRGAGDATPKEADVQQLQKWITVAAPKGAEFGQSDVIYLLVKGRTAEEAVKMNLAVYEQVERRLQLLRNHRFQSVIQELTQKLRLTEANLAESTAQLEAMEREVGSDLGELRTMNQAGAGESNLRTAMNQIKNDLRTAKSKRTTEQQLLDMLTAANQDPKTLVATPNQLLESQPALRRLKEGLIDAQLKVATLKGRMNEAHPEVKAAMTAEHEVRNHLHSELETAIRGLQAEMDVTDAVMESLESQLSDVQLRLDRLASLRARYENLVAEVQNRSDQLKETRRELSEARASQEASQTASVISRVDNPDPGDSPVGPGRTAIFAASWFAGFSLGIGLLLLLVPPSAQRDGTGRRWTDRVAQVMQRGRRSSDLVQPPAPSNPTSTTGRRATDRSTPPVEEPRRSAPLPLVPTQDDDRPFSVGPEVELTDL